jgi:hypothetical protein
MGMEMGKPRLVTIQFVVQSPLHDDWKRKQLMVSSPEKVGSTADNLRKH